MKNKTIKVIKRDLKFGFSNNKYRFLGMFFVFTIIIWINAVNIKQQVIGIGMSSKDIGFIDLFFATFKGSEYISYDQFYLPINWILIYIYITYLIGSYCYDDLSEESSHAIVRMKNRKDMWISKVIWMTSTIFVFYLIILLIISFFSISMFEMSFKWSKFSSIGTLGQLQRNYSVIQFLLFTMCVYILTSMTIAIFQMLISFIIKPTYIYLVNIFILMICIYLKKFLVPIQGSLMLRQNLFDATYPINPKNSIIYNLVVFILIFIAGIRYVKKIDMLASQKTD